MVWCGWVLAYPGGGREDRVKGRDGVSMVVRMALVVLVLGTMVALLSTVMMALMVMVVGVEMGVAAHTSPDVPGRGPLLSLVRPDALCDPAAVLSWWQTLSRSCRASPHPGAPAPALLLQTTTLSSPGRP